MGSSVCEAWFDCPWAKYICFPQQTSSRWESTPCHQIHFKSFLPLSLLPEVDCQLSQCGLHPDQLLSIATSLKRNSKAARIKGDPLLAAPTLRSITPGDRAPSPRAKSQKPSELPSPTDWDAIMRENAFAAGLDLSEQKIGDNGMAKVAKWLCSNRYVGWVAFLFIRACRKKQGSNFSYRSLNLQEGPL